MVRLVRIKFPIQQDCMLTSKPHRSAPLSSSHPSLFISLTLYVTTFPVQTPIFYSFSVNSLFFFPFYSVKRLSPPPSLFLIFLFPFRFSFVCFLVSLFLHLSSSRKNINQKLPADRIINYAKLKISNNKNKNSSKLRFADDCP